MLLFISARGSDAIAARLPPSSRAGRRGDKEKMCFSSIETLSREISRHSAARTIEGWDFSTSLRCGRNDDKGGSPYSHFRRHRMTPLLLRPTVISSGVSWRCEGDVFQRY